MLKFLQESIAYKLMETGLWDPSRCQCHCIYSLAVSMWWFLGLNFLSSRSLCVLSSSCVMDMMVLGLGGCCPYSPHSWSFWEFFGCGFFWWYCYRLLFQELVERIVVSRELLVNFLCFFLDWLGGWGLPMPMVLLIPPDDLYWWVFVVALWVASRFEYVVSVLLMFLAPYPWALAERLL